MKNSTIEIPDNWDDLSDAEKREVTRGLLKAAAADTGLLAEPKRTFKSPAK